MINLYKKARLNRWMSKNEDIINDFKETAKRTQTFYFERFQDRQYDCFWYDEMNLLRSKIAFALFGIPDDSETNPSKDPSMTNESDVQTDEVENAEDNSFLSASISASSSSNQNFKHESSDRTNLENNSANSQKCEIDSSSRSLYHKEIEGMSSATLNQPTPEQPTECRNSPLKNIKNYAQKKRLTRTSKVLKDEVETVPEEINFVEDYFSHSDADDNFEIISPDLDLPSVCDLGYEKYNKTKIKFIEAMVELIKAHSDPQKILIGFVYVIVRDREQSYEHPIFRVKNATTAEICFIDHIGRVYPNWDDYLYNNHLPVSYYCYPETGFYELDEDDNVVLGFDKTPIARGGQTAIDVADVHATAIGATAGALALSFIFVPLAPIMIAGVVTGAVSGSYSVGRGVHKLLDRGQHKQSLNPFQTLEAFEAWMYCVTGIIEIVSVGLAGAAARLFTTGGDTSLDAITLASKTIARLSSAAGKVNPIVQVGAAVIQKVLAGEAITKRDDLYFRASVFYFTNEYFDEMVFEDFVKELKKDKEKVEEDNENTNKEIEDIISERITSSSVKREPSYYKEVKYFYSAAEYMEYLFDEKEES